MKSKRKVKTWQHLLFLSVTLVVLLACGSTPDPTATLPPPPPTEEVATEEAVVVVPQEPTNTTAPVIPPTATPDYQATLDHDATLEAQASVGKILDWLSDINIDLPRGYRVPITSDSARLKVTSYMGQEYEKITPDELNDFIIGVDITWNSSSGLAGCGLILRSEADPNRGSSYQFAIRRLSGAGSWDIEYFIDGKYKGNVTGGVRYHKAIDYKQDSTNRVIVTVIGEEYIVYVNGERLSSAYSGVKLDGHVSFLAWQESGNTTCTFNDAWIWAVTD